MFDARATPRPKQSAIYVDNVAFAAEQEVGFDKPYTIPSRCVARHFKSRRLGARKRKFATSGFDVRLYSPPYQVLDIPIVLLANVLDQLAFE